MTYDQIDEMMQDIAQTIGCGYSYYTNDEATVVKAPFLLFDYPDRDDMAADNLNYVKKQNLNIEYDSSFRDLDTETTIESKLTEYGFFYSKNDAYIDGENVYETMYSMQVVITEPPETAQQNNQEGDNQNA